MSDQTTQTTQSTTASTSTATTPWAAFGAIGGVVTGLISAALGSSLYGLIAIGVLGVIAGIGGPLLWRRLVGGWNANIDSRDQANAGADAGNTAIDIANQGRAVSTGLDAQEKADLPTDGFPKETKQ